MKQFPKARGWREEKTLIPTGLVPYCVPAGLFVQYSIVPSVPATVSAQDPLGGDAWRYVGELLFFHNNGEQQSDFLFLILESLGGASLIGRGQKNLS